MKLRSLLLATAGLALALNVAQAQTALDPLHGACTDGGCLDNGTFTGATATELEGGFGWSISPAGGSGDLTIAILTKTSITSVPTISATQGAPGLGLNTPFVERAGTFTSGDLATFLGLPNASPANPIGGFEVGADAGQTAFNVFTVDAGQVGPLGGAGASLTDIFRLAGVLPIGTEVVAFLTANGSTVSTALSGDLQVTAAAVPAPIVGAGLPGLLAGALGLWGFARRRRARRG